MMGKDDESGWVWWAEWGNVDGEKGGRWVGWVYWVLRAWQYGGAGLIWWMGLGVFWAV